MPSISWMPKKATLIEQIIEEEAKLAEQKEQWEPQTVTPQATSPLPTPMHTFFQELPGDTQPTRWTPQQPQMAQAAQLEQATPEDVQPWELPRQWTESAMEAVGEGISKVPILPDVLKWAAPGFEWVHKNLEKPFAAIITSPFAPDIPWKQGESWLAHQKREYDAWDAPTYVKGAAEFAMPLWWLPWVGWAGKGAKALAVGSKAASAIAKGGKIARVGDAGFLPAGELLDNVLFKAGRLTKAMEHVPVVNKIVKMVGGEGVFIDAKTAGRISALKKAGKQLPKEDALTSTKMELVKLGYLGDMRDGVARLLVPKLQVLEHSAKGGLSRLLAMDSKGVVGSIVPKTKGGSPYLYDVLEGAMKNPNGYKFLTKEAKQYVDTLTEVIDDIWKMGKQEGLRMPKDKLLHRIVKGKMNPDTGRFEATEFGSLFEKTRIHKTMREGIEESLKRGMPLEYGLDISEGVTSTINHYMREIATRRFKKAIRPLGKTQKAKVKEIMGEEGAELAMLRLLQKTGGKITDPARYTRLIKEEESILKHFSGREALPYSAKFPDALSKINSHPSFGNRLFPTKVVKTAEKLLGDEGQNWLSTAAGVSGTSRMLVAAMDLSAPFIQGLAVAGRNPVAWMGMVKKNLEFFLKPANFYKYMTDPKVMAMASERISAGGSGSTFEFFKALGQTQRFLGKAPKVGGLLKKGIGETYGRAEAAFSGGGEAARNYMWQALRKGALTPEGILDPAKAMNLARTIDRMTGVMSTEALAIGRTQRDFENAFVFFAPRYTRSGLSFVKDAMKGGMAGAEARTSLGALMGGGLSMYYGVCTAMGQTPNLNPNSGRFMTVKIGDSHVGIGGIMVALMRFGYDVGITAVEDPANLIKPINEGELNRWDNPFIRFMYARTAPLTSTLMGTVVEQANYFGEPFESVGDWARFMMDKVTPIAVQGVMDDPQPHVAFTEFAGLRVFPKSPWELLDEERDKISLRETGQPYDSLNKLQQTQIDKFDTIKSIQKDVDAHDVSRGDEISVAFANYKREKKTARLVYEETLNDLQLAYDDGVIDGYQFREKMSNAGYGLGTTYEHINIQPEYKGVMEKFQEPSSGEGEPEDVAYDAFMDRMYSNGGFEDQYGIFQFDKYNAYIEEFRSEYGEGAYQYVLDKKAERDENLPALAKELQKAKIVLKPYWKIKEDMIRYRGQPQTEWQQKRLDSLISRLRKRLKTMNPQIAYYLEKFYTRG